MYTNNELAKHLMGIRQLAVMHAIAVGSGEVQMRQLVPVLGGSASSASEVIARLEELGYVVRRQVAHGLRYNSFVKLTAAGRAALKRHFHFTRQLEKDLA
jgi:DNA-binding MarR family transcriptional regulator